MARGQEADRVYRIGLIEALIKECNFRGVGADKNKLIAIFMCKYGIARRTMLEYIKALILSNRIRKDMENLWINE